MERIAARDASALGELYDRHSTLVYALCMRVIGDPSEAEEVLGDVFWEAWRRPERYDSGRGAPLAYLLTLSRSRALDRARTQTRRRRILEESGGEETVKSSLHGGPGTPDPLADAETAEKRSRVLEALDGLQPAQREALELSFFDGLSHSEIAERLGQPLGTIKSRIRHGLIRLRESLQALYGAEGAS